MGWVIPRNRIVSNGKKFKNNIFMDSHKDPKSQNNNRTMHCFFLTISIIPKIFNRLYLYLGIFI